MIQDVAAPRPFRFPVRRRKPAEVRGRGGSDGPGGAPLYKGASSSIGSSSVLLPIVQTNRDVVVLCYWIERKHHDDEKIKNNLDSTHSCECTVSACVPLSNVLVGDGERRHGRHRLRLLGIALQGFAERAAQRGGRALEGAPVFTCRGGGSKVRTGALTLSLMSERLSVDLHSPWTSSTVSMERTELALGRCCMTASGMGSNWKTTQSTSCSPLPVHLFQHRWIKVGQEEFLRLFSQTLHMMQLCQV